MPLHALSNNLSIPWKLTIMRHHMWAQTGIWMETFNIRDLRNRTGELVREAEQGRLSLITKHGHPVFVAVPFDETLLKNGIALSLAIGLFSDRKPGLAQAAKLAGVAPAEMMDLLAAHHIPMTDITADELKDELAQVEDD